MTALEREIFVELKEKLVNKIQELEKLNLDYSTKIAYDNVYYAISCELEKIMPAKSVDLRIDELFDYTKENQNDNKNAKHKSIKNNDV